MAMASPQGNPPALLFQGFLVLKGPANQKRPHQGAALCPGGLTDSNQLFRSGLIFF